MGMGPGDPAGLREAAPAAMPSARERGKSKSVNSGIRNDDLDGDRAYA